MKIHEYNQMMAYLTRQEPPSLPPVASGEQRETFAEGGDPSKQKILKDIKKYVDKKLSKGEVVTLPELNEKFAEGKRREYLYRKALGKKYDKITKLQREGVGRVSLEVKDKLYDIIDEVVQGKRPLMDLSRNNLNKELPPVSERQLSKYLNENKKYKDYELASNVDKVQQRIAKGNEKLKDATLKNIESKLELTTAGLRRPSPRRIEEFIVRDLVRHDNQGGELFKVLPKSNTKFYDKIKILDVKNNDVLTVKKIKELINKGDPRFNEYKKVFEEIKDVKDMSYINPVTKEETTLLKALQQATGNKQPLNIDHLKSVKENPLTDLAVSTYKANTGANIKDITEQELETLGRKKFTPEQNIERLTKFADRRLLQEAASGFEKVKTPLETLAIKEKPSLASRMSNQLAFGPSGMIDVGEEVIKDVKGVYGKYAPQIAKGALTGLQVIGTPLASSLFYGTDVGMELKQAADEGNLTAKKALDAFVGQGEKGLYFLLPELAKDVVTSPIANKILQLGKIGRFATPVGLGLSAVGVGKDFYDQYKEFQALSPEEKEKRIKESTYTPTEQDFQRMQEAESRASAAKGGRIGFAEGSDEIQIPTLTEKPTTSIYGKYASQIANGKVIERGPKQKGKLGPEDPLSKYKSYSEEELAGNIEAKKPNFDTLEDYILQTMPVFEPKDVAPPKSYSPMPVEEYLRKRYQIDLAEGGPSDPSKRKFIKGAGVVGALGVAAKYAPELFTAAKKAAPKIAKVIENAPEWFSTFLSKVVNEKTFLFEGASYKGGPKAKIHNYVDPESGKAVGAIDNGDSIDFQFETDAGMPGRISYIKPSTKIDPKTGEKIESPGLYEEYELVYRGQGDDYTKDVVEEIISGREGIAKIGAPGKISKTDKAKYDFDEAEGQAQSELDRMKDEGLFDD